MNVDAFGNIITPTRRINGHVLTTGTSGYGKTFGLCRQIEESYIAGENVIVIDFSGAFSEVELKKHNFRFPDQVNRVSLKGAKLYLGENFESKLSKAITEAFNIGSYTQKGILHRILQEILASEETDVPFEYIMQLLNLKKYEKNERMNKNDIENVGNLINRFFPYAKDGPLFSREIMPVVDQNITVYSFESMAIESRLFFAKLLITLIWLETLDGYPNRRVLVIDELQNIEFGKNTALGEILREGRKYGLSVFLATQFISGAFEQEVRGLIQQCATHYMYHCIPADCRILLDLFPCNERKFWQDILLRQLSIGKCVIIGECTANGRNRAFDSRVIVDVRGADYG